MKPRLIRKRQMEVRITIKGHMLLAAIESGMIEENADGNYAIEKFEKFWDYLIQNKIVQD